MRFSLGILPALLVAVVLQANVSAQIPVSKGRSLAAHALKVIEPNPEWGDTALGPVDLELAKNPDLAWTPNYAPTSETLVSKSKQLVFRNDIYNLEFAFKPVRMVEVNGRVVWYMLYRVRYLGGDLKPVPEPDKYNNEVFGTPKAVSAEWVRFMPTFKLDTLNLGKSYLDQVDRNAMRIISEKERVGSKIYDSIELQRMKIPLSTATDDKPIWGVAIWHNVDPRTDFFRVEVRGLTNAQKMEMQGGKIKYLQKLLALHFFRPGDELEELRDQIRFGIPALENAERQKYVLDQFGQKERLDHVWIYR